MGGASARSVAAQITLVVVEGYMDVIAVFGRYYRRCGTAWYGINPEQIVLAGNYAANRFCVSTVTQLGKGTITRGSVFCGIEPGRWCGFDAASWQGSG